MSVRIVPGRPISLRTVRGNAISTVGYRIGCTSKTAVLVAVFTQRGQLVAVDGRVVMGVSIRMNDSKFWIDAAKKQDALKAAKPVYGHWVREGEGKRCRTLEELLELWGYEADVDDDGNITGLNLCNEKLGAEHDMFKTIAPFVKKGSFLEMGGDFGAWRWVFDGNDCKEKRARF